MKYNVRFPTPSIENRFDKVLSKIPQINIQDDIMETVEKLADNPRPYGKKAFKKLSPPVQFHQFAASYRMRVRNYRVLYDVEDKGKIVWILALRKRGEKTYK